MMYFPVFTQIEGKRCLIVGGGKVAARKVHTLLQYGADIVVIAKKVWDEIKEILPKKCIFEDFIINENGFFLEKEIQEAGVNPLTISWEGFVETQNTTAEWN